MTGLAPWEFEFLTSYLPSYRVNTHSLAKLGKLLKWATDAHVVSEVPLLSCLDYLSLCLDYFCLT